MSEPSSRSPGLSRLGRTTLDGDAAVASSVTTYDDLARGAGEEAGMARRRRAYMEVTNNFYDLVTDFYEYGWGDAFHFAPRRQGESFRESLRRHEHYLALKLRLEPGEQLLDLGCGIGGPMRAIAAFAGVSITGVNNHSYQLQRAEQLNREAGLETSCRVVKADFHGMPFADGSYDKAYAVEAMVHAPAPVAVYREIARLLKPGGLFASYEWCTTDLYDAANPAHRALKDAILVGNGLPAMSSCREATAAMEEAGFDVLLAEDRALTGEIPWYEPLAPQRLTPATFRAAPVGRRITTALLSVLAAVRLVPRGTPVVASFLDEAARALADAGKAGIFTPAFLILGRRR